MEILAVLVIGVVLGLAFMGEIATRVSEPKFHKSKKSKKKK